MVSILNDKEGLHAETAGQPDFFPDLNLDQVVEAITTPKQEYNLQPFFWTPLRDAETVRYRQEVFQDLENEPVMEHIKEFAKGMSVVRRYLAMIEKLDFDYHRKGWFLEAALVYCDAVATLAGHLDGLPLSSRGLSAFREYLVHYVQSPAYRSLATEGQQVKSALAEIKYCVIIGGGGFKVKRYEGEADYSPEVENTFKKFKQSDAQDYLAHLPERTGMSHIEAKILEFVARLYPEPFAALNRFCTEHNQFLDETIQTFDREIQFYVAYLDFIADLKHQGLPFCYPQLSATSKAVYVRDGFDLALAHAWRGDKKVIVLNGFFLNGPERILVVTGPNQGGKTTFARMFGQLHYLASLGCPVPGREAALFLADHIFTHFERIEDIRNLRGKLEDDLVRMRDALAQATADSIFILNEIFSSTTVQDTLFLSKEIMARLMDLDVLGVWVTFLDELASLSEKTVSMVALVDPDDPTRRTFKITRKPADGLAYALSLARKHGLAYEQLQERIP
uniref:DNA mismatch repair protein MutS n=1 Tax=Desulfomonile tiedjei TaxID=2358 RepID=A0A7C4ARA7_9BACT